MYLGIDIGGTKTLVAALSDDGAIKDSRRFPTDHDYGRFLENLSENLKQLTLEGDYPVCAGVPGLIDRSAGTVHSLGNLPWRDKPIRDDISALLSGRPVMIENDAKLAGLYEALAVKDRYSDRVLFVTVSTGIGGALVHGGRIVEALRDTEMGKMPLEYGGKIIDWEDFAGGRGVVANLGKRAEQITDPEEWRQVGEPIAYGLGAACAVLQPEVIILGGSVGRYADNYKGFILDYLASRLHPNIRQPKDVLAASNPDEAVIYGCYELLRQEG